MRTYDGGNQLDATHDQPKQVREAHEAPAVFAGVDAALTGEDEQH